MPNTLQESMEDVSFAYMQALCAYNGYTLSKVERDNDGVDATIRCKGIRVTLQTVENVPRALIFN